MNKKTKQLVLSNQIKRMVRLSLNENGNLYNIIIIILKQMGSHQIKKLLHG